MARILSLTMALGCAASLAACQTTTAPGVMAPGALSTAGLTQAGVPPATAAKIGSTIAKAQGYAKLACGIIPTASSVANLFVASNGTLSTAEALAKVACDALANSGAYSADMPRRAAQKATQRGAPVTGTAIVNGKPVAVQGHVAR